MRRTRRVALIGLILATTVVAAHLRAQAPAAPVRQVAYLKASNPQVGAHFGCGGALDGHAGVGVAISSDGNTIAVGAPHESSGARGINGNQNDTSLYDSGAVYVFTRRGNAWEQQAYVKASNAVAGAQFGHTIALSAAGKTVALPANGESSASRGADGNQTDRSAPQPGAGYDS